MDAERRAQIETILGHAFADPTLLDAALTHPSFACEHEGAAGYDRLEFLGDAVLGFIISNELYRLLPDAPEGELTRRKHHAVSGEALAEVADELDLGAFVSLGRGAESAGERLRASILENLMEAAIGALYLDGGLEAATRFAVRVLEARYAAPAIPETDPKSALQQHTQGELSALPEYRISEVSGPPHERVFTADVLVRGTVLGSGSGATKQAAEKAAAIAALAALAEDVEPGASDA